MKLQMLIELDYNAEIMHDGDIGSRKWFFQTLLDNEPEALLLHSQIIGDTVGSVRVIKILEPTPNKEKP